MSKVQNNNKINRIFGPDGLLAKSLPGFEHRPGQEKMAGAVLDILIHEGRLLVEAGTGIGKTLAYLIPAALSGRRVVIATGTKNLQDQILSKEVPFLQKHLFPELAVVCLKGKKNYLCLHKWKHLQMQSDIQFSEQLDLWPRLNAWIAETKTGDRAELSWLPDKHPLWNDISSSAEQCLGSACTEAESCYINILRKEAARADIIVVNHHLFFSDMVVRDSGYGEVIPRHEAVVFDEAHHIEDVATTYLGYSVSAHRLSDLIRDAEKEMNTGLLASKTKLACLKKLAQLRERVETFFNLLPVTEGRVNIRRPLDREPVLGTLQEAITRQLAEQGRAMEDLSAKNEGVAPLSRRFFDIARDMTAIATMEDPNMIYWLEKKERSVVLAASPLDVTSAFQAKLYSHLPAFVFTSATLTVKGNFDFYKSRVGLDEETIELNIPSPFDYARQTLLYIPKNIPEPQSPVFCAALSREIETILDASSGRALVLFTSYRNMQEVYHIIKDRLPFPLLMQGEKPRPVLLELFQRDVQSVLLATNSFWEGIDVPGESLSCVIIDKLPFGVPSDPVMKGRIDWLNRQGKNPFSDYQLPLAVLSLRQGIGRLIRSKNDRGLLAILDVRTLKRGYGVTFLQSLPQTRLTHNLEEVRRFFLSAPSP
ncbi:MAG: ATP-dependent DNA helicase [Thermodesulfobacteriota bacterium]|nr:ATP-dependent DNA helicase [Thermodesulfobacteriota bacterium]